MAVLVPLLLLVVPCALGVWLWLNMRGNDDRRTAYRLRKLSPQPSRPSPNTMRDNEIAPAFRVGNRYYHKTKNRVFECIALKGKKARLVAFGCLDSVENEKAFLKECPEFGGYHKVRTVGGVETCVRGALRADRQATEKETAEEFDFLRQLREREGARRADNFPAAGVVGV